MTELNSIRQRTAAELAQQANAEGDAAGRLIDDLGDAECPAVRSAAGRLRFHYAAIRTIAEEAVRRARKTETRRPVVIRSDAHATTAEKA